MHLMILSKNIKQLFYKLHLYVGISMGLLITLICITGSLIVYKPELEKLSIPHLAKVEVLENRIGYQEAYERIKKAYPDHNIQNMVVYGATDEAWSFRSTHPAEKGRIQLYINQYTGEVLGADHYNSKWMQILYDLHVNLLSGKTGLKIVAFCGFILLFILISGLLILPNRNLFKWKREASLKVKFFRSHYLIGLLFGIPLAILAFTGGYYGFKPQYQNLFEKISNGKAIVASPRVDHISKMHQASLDSVVNRASRAFPEGEVSMVFFPQKEGSVFSVRMKDKVNYERTGGNHIYIHPNTAELVKTNLWRDKPSAEKMTRSMYFLHFGTFWGNYSRILWLITGFAIPFLYFTGLYLWIKKLRKRRMN